ncbi:MAG: hypothetical protein QOE71_682, partial [Pseudonocardiales bacterium]|nr:hypothetical protein [Pseudonocardiales bacterium]
VPPGRPLPRSASPLAQLGKPYVFGSTGPDSYDCSGLTMAAWAAAGVPLPHYTVTQASAGTPVATTESLRPGDLVFIPGATAPRTRLVMSACISVRSC